jgi:hypothetical protein
VVWQSKRALLLALHCTQAKKAQAAATVIKRRSDKMTKEELEAQLFILFGQQQHWHFTQIQVGVLLRD